MTSQTNMYDQPSLSPEAIRHIVNVRVKKHFGVPMDEDDWSLANALPPVPGFDAMLDALMFQVATGQIDPSDYLGGGDL